MRKLTVKNFSVIKEAELEFGKITVLIGPQAGGKSLLCKLAYFCAQVVPEIIENYYNEHRSYDALVSRVADEFAEKFPRDSWLEQSFKVQYRAKSFEVSISEGTLLTGPRVDFPEEFENRSRLRATPKRAGFNYGSALPRDVRKRQELEGERPFPPVVEESIYIPTGRAFYSIPNRAYMALSTKNLDWITQRYAPEFDADYKALRELYESDSDICIEFADMATQVLKGKVVSVEGRLLFESANDSRRNPFELLSSGTLELLPIINTLSQIVQNASEFKLAYVLVAPFGVVSIEEPELSIFPNTQNALVRMLAWLSNTPFLDMSYTITTHSPYILTAFNNLIEAGQVARAKPESKDEVAKLIAEHYWIKEGAFKAYAIEDGVLKSIVAEDTGLASANYLDQVSETIGAEFDELLRLGYVES